jgi:tetratricopeptide (TPR) repeat protein
MKRFTPCSLALVLVACGPPTRPKPQVTLVAPVVSAAPEPPPPRPEDPRLAAISAELGLRKQEERELSLYYLRSGKKLMEDLRYKEALADVDKAVRLDPENAEARELDERLLVLTGERRGHKAVIEALAGERKALIAQERFELARLYAEGVDLFTARRYDAAIMRFEAVIEKVRWFPYEIGPDDTAARAERSLADARAMAKATKARDRERLQQAALEKARALSGD